MKLILAELPAEPFAKRGVYGPSKDTMVPRQRFLAPDAAESLVLLEKANPGKLYYSDVLRAAEVSLHALQAGRKGIQPPGFSAHNYGLAVDMDVERSVKRLGVTYAALLNLMATYGWHCHRRDGKRAIEDWHFNYLGADAAKYLAETTANPKTWAHAVELRIQERYGDQMRLTAVEVQAALARLHMYSGQLDGKLGPISKEAIKVFQRAWALEENGDASPRFQRVLALVSADREIHP